MNQPLLNSYTLLELRHHESLYNRNSVKVKLVEPAKDYIFNEFKDWNKVLEKKNEDISGYAWRCVAFIVRIG